jgi:glycine dehydrogenase subunit 1
MKDYQDMLDELGISSAMDLFIDIPEAVRTQGLDLPPGMDEQSVKEHMKELFSDNQPVGDLLSFTGGGVYNHYVPSAVKHITQRSEFYTAYTPYQAEASQGMLQALFEYQSHIAELTGMDVANASLYDGATAIVEAAMLAARATRKHEFIVPESISWEKRQILETYFCGTGLKLRYIPYEKETGCITIDAVKSQLGDDTAGVYIENPNYFGMFEDAAFNMKAELGKALLVVGVNPISLGAVRPPGDYGADVVVGEGQSLGIPMNFGGPLLGMMAARKELMRKMPGRLIGMTEDVEGNRAFCITLQTREQHIRRERATSNICTNQALCAVAAAVHMSLLGSNGFRTLAKRNMEMARKLCKELAWMPGFVSPWFKGHFFNEFVAVMPNPADVHKSLLQRGIIGGKILKRQPGLEGATLFTATEMTSDDDIKRLIDALIDILEGEP